MSAFDIRTTLTETKGDVHCLAQSLQSSLGEDIITLLAVEGRAQEAQRLIGEWEQTLQQTLLMPPPEGESAYDRLEGTLKELNGLLKGMLLGESIRDAHALIAIVDEDNVLHLSPAGRSEAYLTRDGSTVQITERTGSGREIPHFLHIASGDLEAGDIVTFSTARLLRSLTPAQISQHARNQEDFLDTLRSALEQEREPAALAVLTAPIASAHMPPAAKREREYEEETIDTMDDEEDLLPHASRRRKGGPPATQHIGVMFQSLAGMLSRLPDRMGKAKPYAKKLAKTSKKTVKKGQSFFRQFLEDLHSPTRKRRAHLLLLAIALTIFIAIWLAFRLSSTSRISQTRQDLERLVAEINQDLRTAENRQLMGDLESANAILNRAEQEARNVMQNESGLFRTDALDILDRIRAKRESVNNIFRLTPAVTANIAGKNPNVSSLGIIGIQRGRMIVYDRQNLYSIIVNAVDDPQRLDGENLIVGGDYFERFQTSVFMTRENRLIELVDGVPTAMKTDDAAGWLPGQDMETYNRFLYILSPQNNQIYKYERLGNRYSEPEEYRVSDVSLANGIDMVIDSDVYILNRGGSVTKLLRGETSPFAIRNLPEGALDNTTKVEKPSDQSNFYFMDPEARRIIITRREDDLGESQYLKQYVLEGEQVGTLRDLFVDAEESQLYVLDEKRVYVINLQEG